MQQTLRSLCVSIFARHLCSGPQNALGPLHPNTGFGESVVCSDCADDGHTPLDLASTSPLYLTIHSPAFASSSRNRPLPAPGIADFVILTCFGLLLGYDFFGRASPCPKCCPPVSIPVFIDHFCTFLVFYLTS